MQNLGELLRTIGSAVDKGAQLGGGVPQGIFMEYQWRVRVALLREWYVCKWSVRAQGERTVVEGTV